MGDIRLEHVTFAYSNGFEAVSDNSICIRQGERVAIVGQNGAGKTTTVKLMNNLLKPTKGDVFISDKNTKDHTTAQIAKEVGYVFQNPDDQIFHATVIEEVRYGPKAALHLEEDEITRRSEEAIRAAGLWDVREENPFDLPLSVRKFVAVAAIMAVEPDVYIFDEPTAGQDKIGLERLGRIIDHLHGQGKTVITITHDMEFVVRTFERIIVMAQKKIIMDGCPAEVFYHDDIVEKARLKVPCAIRFSKALDLEKTIITNEQLAEALARRNYGV